MKVRVSLATHVPVHVQDLDVHSQAITKLAISRYSDYCSAMSLADHKGSPSHPEMFKHLIGDTVKACFLDSDGRTWVLMTCGHAVVFAGPNGGTPTYWHELPESVARTVQERMASLKKKIAEVKDLAPGLDL